VAESRRVAAMPRRPAWRDSDPRWRRRMLAGTWILVLVPLMSALQIAGWTARVPIPTIFDYRGTLTLEDTFAASPTVYQPVAFCVGVVLLFSKERGRRRDRLDWTRHLGVVCTYATALLSAAGVLFIAALGLAGIAAVFLSLPLANQPSVTQLLVNVSSWYLRHGAQPRHAAGVVQVAFSSITILLASVPLFEALRSTGPKWAAATLPGALALFAVMHLSQTVRYCLGFLTAGASDVFHYWLYFWPDVLVISIENLTSGAYVSEPGAFVMEATKWSIVLAIAVWLSIAQIAAWRGKTRGSAHRIAPLAEAGAARVS
jgi:hypothetical protein